MGNIFQELGELLQKDVPRTLEGIRRRKAARKLRRKLIIRARDLLLTLLAILSAGFGLKGFLIPNGLIDGGVTGISLLINKQTGASLSILIVLINIPFLLMGYRQHSAIFSLKSVFAIGALALAVAFIPYPMVTNDRLLVAIFGGFFLGAGIGLAIRGGGVIDGTEVLAIFMSRKWVLSVGDFILIFNVLIFSVAAYLLTVEIALYSILTYLSASKTVDFILEGIEEYTGVTVITNHSRQVSTMIKERLGHGLTIYQGRKGFGRSGESDQNIDIIYIIVTRLEVNRLKSEIESIDPHAFIIMQSVRDTKGGMVKKKPLK